MFRLKGIALLLLVLLPVISLAKVLEFEKRCGEYKYIITVDNAENYYESTIKHYYQEGNAEKKLFHQSETGMHVSASCTKDKNNTDVLVFTEICGGSGCLDGIYGLFDLKQKKLLLNPSDWPKGNEKELINSLGNDFLLSANYEYRFKNREFCCVDELSNYDNT